MTAVLHHSRAKGTNKLILLGIANHEGDGGAWPTIETLAKYGACSRSKVKQALAELAAMDEIRIDRQAGGNADTRADRRPNRYRVMIFCPQECDGSWQHRVGDGGHTGNPRRDDGHFLDGGQNQAERGSLFTATGVTRLTPNRPIEPSNVEPSVAAAAEATAQTESQRANSITKTYAELVPLSNFPAIAGIVRKAIRANRYSDEEITEALERMARDGRPVTTDALRIELEGMPEPRRKKSGTQIYLEAVQELHKESVDPHWVGMLEAR